MMIQNGRKIHTDLRLSLKHSTITSIMTIKMLLICCFVAAKSNLTVKSAAMSNSTVKGATISNSTVKSTAISNSTVKSAAVKFK